MRKNFYGFFEIETGKKKNPFKKFPEKKRGKILQKFFWGLTDLRDNGQDF